MSKIGFITTSFMRHKDDVAGSFVFGLARELGRLGHSIEVIVPEPPRPAQWQTESPWLEGIEVFGAPYARPATFQKLFFGAGVPDNLANNPILAGLIPGALAGLAAVAATRAGRWDGVISHWLVPSALIAGIVGRSRIRHLAIAHSGDVHLLRRIPGGKFLARAVVGCANHIGFVSEGLRREFFELLDVSSAGQLRDCSSITPMGIDLESLETQRSKEAVRREINASGFVVLFLGRLVPIKGVDLLIDAVAGLKDCTLIIAGDGPDRNILEQRAASRGADVRFMGLVGPRLRAELLGACDVVALPSRTLPSGRHEGIPLVLAEALAAGCPVVAANSGGIGEFLEHEKTGFLVDPDDVEGLGRALETLANNPVLRQQMSAAGSFVGRGRDWRRLVKEYERLVLSKDSTGDKSHLTRTISNL
jgi:glycosyltransferase involved in cell wall biosynthesis